MKIPITSWVFPWNESEKQQPEASDGRVDTLSTVSEEATDLVTKNDDGTRLGNETIEILHRRLLPVTLVLVILSYIDRGNLGFVAPDVCTELDMSHTEYGIGVGLFGFGYVTSQIPSNYFLRRFGPTRWFTFLLIFWGLIAASFAFIQSTTEFYILRLLLGVAEGGTFPGVWYFLTTFYPKDYMTVPYSMLESAILISTPLAAPLAAGILTADSVSRHDGWRVLFFFEGLLPILFGCALYWILPPSPDEAWYLQERHKQWIKENGDGDDAGENTNELVKEIGIVVKETYFWMICSVCMIRGVLLTTAFYWTTLIIDDMLNKDDDDDDDDHTCSSSKSTDTKVVLLTAVPFTIAAVLSIVLGRATKNSVNRSRAAGFMIGGSGAFLIGWVVFRHHSFVVSLLFMSMAIGLFIFPNALMVGLIGSFFDKQTRATAIAGYNSIAGIGMSIGPILVGWMVDQYGYGLTVTCLAIAAAFGGILLFPVVDPLGNPDESF